MKRIVLALGLIIVFLTSCSGKNMGIFTDNNGKANKTIESIANALENNDKEQLKNLFSENAQKQADNIDAQIDRFMNLLGNKIVSYTKAEELGVAASVQKDDGKTNKELEAVFSFKTNQEVFHVAMKICTINTFDRKNVGVKSIYIINANDWQNDCVYRGDGKWSPGIIFE